MLKPAIMSKIDCIVEHSAKDGLIRALHISGKTQLEVISDDEIGEKSLVKELPQFYAQETSQTLSSVKSIAEILKPYRAEKTSFLDEMLGVEDVKKVGYNYLDHKTLIQDGRQLVERLQPQVRSITENFEKNKSELERVNSELSSLKQIKCSEILAKYFADTKYLYSAIGYLQTPLVAEARKRLDEKIGREYVLTVESKETEKAAVTVHCMKKSKNDMLYALNSLSFEQIKVSGDGSYAQIYDLKQKEAEKLKNAINETLKSLSVAAKDEYGTLLQMAELLSNELERANSFANMASTKNTTYLRLWVPTKDKDKTLKTILRESKGLAVFSVTDDPDDAPTLLDNPHVLKPFEMFTKLFAQPKYGQIDPTAVTAPSFVIFFGFMLADAAYGVLIVAASMWLMKKYEKHEKVVNFAKVLFWGGLSTILFGILTGGFLGDALSKYVLGLDSPQGLPFVLIDPLYKSNAIILLTLAVAVGAIQTVFGNVLGLLDKLASGKKSNALTENGSWLIMGAGLTAAYGVNTYVGGGIFAIGFILLFKHMGPMAVMELPGALGRIVSYSRLLALHLTTPGMGLAFNFLSSLLYQIPLIGPFVALAVFMSSHIIILLMNALGSFVHALRLHYVEYYGTFYGGGGIAFQPFSEKERYTIRRQ